MTNHQIHTPRREGVFNDGQHQRTLKQRHNLDCSNSRANQLRNIAQNLEQTTVSTPEQKNWQIQLPCQIKQNPETTYINLANTKNPLSQVLKALS